MKYQISKLIWHAVIVAVVLLGAMFLLPVISAVLIGVFALSGLLWISGKVFGFFQNGEDYSSENPEDFYDGTEKPKFKRVTNRFAKDQVEDAVVIAETKNRKI